jgi:hypothetical protein
MALEQGPEHLMQKSATKECRRSSFGENTAVGQREQTAPNRLQ